MRKNKKKTKDTTNSDLKKVLNREKVSKIKFNEFKSGLGTFLITCTFYNEDRKPSARGVSICSFADTFDRKKGKHKAFNRAVKAITNKINDDQIVLRDEIKRYIRRTTKNFESLKPFINYTRKRRTINYKGNQKIEFSIDATTPIQIARNDYHFLYKSEYNPRVEITSLHTVPGIKII